MAASLAPGSSVSVVARRYEVNANQVFAWRKLYREAAADPAAPHLVPVMVTPDRPTGFAPVQPDDLIEIDLAGGYRVRMGSSVKASALRLVLDVLERR